MIFFSEKKSHRAEKQSVFSTIIKNSLVAQDQKLTQTRETIFRYRKPQKIEYCENFSKTFFGIFSTPVNLFSQNALLLLKIEKGIGV